MKFSKLEKSLNQTISSLLTSATENFQNSLQTQLSNMSQSMQQMQSTLLAQFQALQSSTNMDSYPMETVNTTDEPTTSDIGNTKIANYSFPSSPLQTATNMLIPTRHEQKYASNASPPSPHNHTLSQNSHRNDGFYLSQGTTAPSSQGGMTQ